MYSQCNDTTDDASAPTLPERSITGERLLASLRHASQVIADHKDQLNSLNVFPVPDGDTGTNMSMTMRAAIDAIGDEDSPNLSADQVASTFAFGALMGARGNSGVILSQILRGFANSVEGKSSLTAADIVAGIGSAATSAYKAVITPVEGTMLTVMSGAAAGANAALVRGGGIQEVLDAAADGAGESLSHTPELLAVLQRARVVDAGGQGVAYMLRAISNHARGDLTPIQIGELHPVPYTGDDNASSGEVPHAGSGFCTNFVVFGDELDLDELRVQFGAVGESAVVIGDRAVVKVHIHTDRPDQVLGLAMSFGRLDRVSIDNMDRQIEQIAATANQKFDNNPREFEVIAVAAGAGQATTLLSVGATSVVQSNDDTGVLADDLLRAVSTSLMDHIILVPNDPESTAAASEVAKRSDKVVKVVNADAFAGQLAALSGRTLTLGMEASVEQMTELAKSEQSLEIVFDTGNGYVALRHEKTAPMSKTINEALQRGLDQFNISDPEMCTIFTGINAAPEDTASILETLEVAFSESDVEVVDGGQNRAAFIIVFE